MRACPRRQRGGCHPGLQRGRQQPRRDHAFGGEKAPPQLHACTLPHPPAAPTACTALKGRLLLSPHGSQKQLRDQRQFGLAKAVEQMGGMTVVAKMMGLKVRASSGFLNARTVVDAKACAVASHTPQLREVETGHVLWHMDLSYGAQCCAGLLCYGSFFCHATRIFTPQRLREIPGAW